MSVVFIYSHDERHRVDPVARALEARGFEVTLGPLGHEVGSDEWLRQVRVDIEAADAVVAFVTRKAVHDGWFEYRVKLAMKLQKRLLPVKMDAVDFGPRLSHPLGRYQYLTMLDPTRAERDIESIASVLPKPRPRVECFLSYSRADAAFVQRLKADLAGRGVTCWRDLDDIPAGASWDREIENALTKCSHVLLVVSARSVESANVADEVSYARDRKKAIIPLLLDDAPLPLRVHRAQAIDFRGDYAEAFQKLVGSLGVS